MTDIKSSCKFCKLLVVEMAFFPYSAYWFAFEMKYKKAGDKSLLMPLGWNAAATDYCW